MSQTYTVAAGDTLYGIARKFGVTVAAITAANNIANPSLIHPGQVLTIPDAAPSTGGVTPPLPPRPAPPPPPAPTPPPAPPAPLPAPEPSVPLFYVAPYQFPRFNLKDPTAMDPNNLIANGSMGPDNHDTPYGTVVNSWEPFIVSGAPPNFRWVDNEQIEPGGSQQIFSENTFDAGVMQTVHNLQPGTFYMFRLGYSLAAKSYDGPNVRVQTIGRKLGVDPFGGTDPRSPKVIWGPDLFDGKAAVNRPEMHMIFAARATSATIFLRAMATDGSGGENRVWFDAVCMEARPEISAVEFPVAQPPAPPVPPAPPPAPSATTYTVVSGDTLYGIARRFGVSVAALTAANNIANPNLIKPGQVLKIPK